MSDIRNCTVTDCKFNNDGECEAEHVYIEEVFTASGFHPMCTTYEEDDD